MLANAKTFLLLGLMTGLILLIGQTFGDQGGLTIALGIALVMNVGSYWFSDKIAIRMAQAQPVDESTHADLVAMVRDLSTRAGQPMPKLFVSPSPQLNAFATGRNPDNAAVCVNQGLFDVMNRDELEGILGHELQHVYNRDILIGSVAGVIATAITFFARFALFFGGGRDRNSGSAITQLALVFLAPIAAMLIRAAITRSREEAADLTGAQLTGNPLALARALAKLEAGHNDPRRLRAGATRAETNDAMAHLFIAAPFGGRLSFSKLFSTHPPIPERIARLEALAVEMGQLPPGA